MPSRPPDLETRPLQRETRAWRDLRLRAGTLVVVAGPDRGRRFVFQPPAVRVGTAADNDVVLTDDTVSKYHVRIEERPDGFVLVDVGSTNGTFLESARVREGYLAAGSQFRVGSSVFQFQPPDGAVEVKPSDRDGFGLLRGDSPRMRDLFGLLERIAPTDLSVLILGETGTGKEVVAQSIHDESPRAKKPFTVLDCSAVPRDLMESTLFGHKQGAFTGATDRRKGAFLTADGGTLFIDEIGELDIELQPKLLRVLEKREVQPLGSDAPQKVDVRVIAATHRDLRHMVKTGAFRQDLFYRLSVMEVLLPPLRERRQDIPLLVQHFLALAGAPDRVITPAAMQSLSAHPLPGNVRELRNLVERALALAGPDPIEPDDILLPHQAAPAAPSGGPTGDRTLESVEAETIRATLQRTGWNRSQAARILGINRKTLIEKIGRYGLKPDDE
jgi:DNA-binding NtrC family response regulator